MRKLIFPLIAFGLIISSCKKEDDESDNASPSRTELLTNNSSKDWLWTKVIFNGQDITEVQEECNMDDINTFMSNGVLIADEGPSKCDSTDEQSTELMWAFVNNDNVLRIIEEGDTVFADVVSLTATKFVMETEYEEDSVKFVVRQELTAK